MTHQVAVASRDEGSEARATRGEGRARRGDRARATLEEGQCNATRVTRGEGVTQQARRKTKGWARGVMYTGEKGGVSK